MKQCIDCGDTLPSDTPYDSCLTCIALNSTSLSDYDHDIEEFDSVEDMIQQAMNEELGLD